MHIIEYLVWDLLIRSSFSSKSLEFNYVYIIEIIKVCNLHFESDIVLLASETVIAYLLIWDFLLFKRLDHFKKYDLWFFISSAVYIEGAPAYFHAVITASTTTATFIVISQKGTTTKVSDTWTCTSWWSIHLLGLTQRWNRWTSPTVSTTVKIVWLGYGLSWGLNCWLLFTVMWDCLCL